LFVAPHLLTPFRARAQIVGLDSHPTRTPEAPRRMLYAHIDALRRRPDLRRCEFMIIPEANTDMTAQLLSQVVLRRYRDVSVLSQLAHAYGVFTKPGDPERYVMRMRDKLAEDGLFLHETVVCANPYSRHGTQAARIAETMREFKRQMNSFRSIHLVPTSLGHRVRVVYTGKADKDNKRSKSLKDDMCMALILGYFWYTQSSSALPYCIVRRSNNMLRLEPGGGTRVEGGRPVDNNAHGAAGALGKRKER